MPTAPGSAIQTIAVIGAGPAGLNFAQSCLSAGFRVVLEDVLPARLRHARADLATWAEAPDQSRLQMVLTVEDAVREADLALDFVPDELESKLEIFSMIDRMAPPRTILCTPTETLSIVDLASCVYRPERCFSLRGAQTGSGWDVHAARSLCYPASVEVGVLQAMVSFFERLGVPLVAAEDTEAPILMKNASLPS